MTISSEINRSGPYSGDGATTAFDYKFKILEPRHLQVIRTDASGTDTILVLDADYTVTGVGNDGGGSAVITPAPAAGSRVTLLLDVPFTQETDLENQGAYYAETVEQALDLVVMRLQQLKERAARAVTIPPSFDSATIDKLIADVLTLSDKGDALEAVAAVSQYLETVADIAGDIPDVAGLTETTQQKAAEAAQSATAANASAGLAAAYAANPEDVSVPGSGGLFSAFHWYRKTLAIYNDIANTLAGWLHGAAAKTDIVDSDEFAIADSAAGWGLKKVLAGSIVKYVVSAVKLDFMVGFVPVYSTATTFTVGGGFGLFGGKKHTTAGDVTCSLATIFGTGQGCLDTGSMQAGRTYFVYAVKSLTEGTTKFVASLSAIESGVAVPLGWELLSGSRLGIILTNSFGNIVTFQQSGNRVLVGNNLLYSNTAGNATWTLLNLSSCPMGISVDALVFIDVSTGTNGDAISAIGPISPLFTGLMIARSRATGNAGGGGTELGALTPVRTNASAQVMREVDITGTASVAAYLAGWDDWQCKRLWA
ncbi:hypothetical protein LVY75_23090 [Sinorhizobium sp. B11]